MAATGPGRLKPHAPPPARAASGEAADPRALIARLQAVIATIPYGQTRSYGEIAQLAGAPGRARLVGRVLREAPPELGLPWQRVIKSDGRLAFALDSPAWHEQRRRLLAEGVNLIGGRVDPACRGRADVDALLWRGPI